MVTRPDLLAGAFVLLAVISRETSFPGSHDDAPRSKEDTRVDRAKLTLKCRLQLKVRHVNDGLWVIYVHIADISSSSTGVLLDALCRTRLSSATLS